MTAMFATQPCHQGSIIHPSAVLATLSAVSRGSVHSATELRVHADWKVVLRIHHVGRQVGVPHGTGDIPTGLLERAAEIATVGGP